MLKICLILGPNLSFKGFQSGLEAFIVWEANVSPYKSVMLIKKSYTKMNFVNENLFPASDIFNLEYLQYVDSV